ncbi:hypothetical protein ACEK07_35745 [Alcanivoracaceae bacterium MT1]
MKKMRKPMRNPAACNPLMRKGGPHQPGRQTMRPRLDWRDALEDYDDWQQEEENEEGPDGPSFLGPVQVCVVTVRGINVAFVIATTRSATRTTVTPPSV